MRRLLSLLVLSLAIALAGCGGDDETSTPLDAALAYLPADSPFAIAIDTDVDGDQYTAIDEITKRFPVDNASIEDLLREQLSAGGEVDYDEDVKPILGNPAVIGASDVRSFVQSGENDDFVAALQAKDQDALDALIEKSEATVEGEVGEAQKYASGGTTFAVNGDVVILAASEGLLDDALERAAGDDHLDLEAFDAALDGLPEKAVVRVYADLQTLLASDPDTRDARKVKWVAALRTLGMTASAKADEVDVEFNLRTDPEGLTDGDLPIASGDEAPPVIEREGEIGFGIRDPSQIVKFAEAAGQAIDPSGFGDYAQAKQTLDSQLGVNIDDDLIAQLSGNLAASVALDGAFGVRADLDDPAAFEKTLEKVAEALPAFAEGAGGGEVALERPEGGNPFYALAQPDGDSVVFGVVDGVFVLANDPDRAGELATGEPTAVDGAKGAVAMSSDAQELANAIIEQYGEAFGLGGFESLGARLFTDPFETLSGSISASTDGVRGRVSLSLE